MDFARALLLIAAVTAPVVADNLVGNPSAANPSGQISAPPTGAFDPSFTRDCGGVPVKCACDCDDPFDPRTVQEAGLYKGMCLNTCDQRSMFSPGLTLLRENGYLLDYDPRNDTQPFGQTIFIANIADYDTAAKRTRYFVGRINTAGLQDVIVQVEYHGGVAGHGQLRLRFRPEMPVVLVPQCTGERDADPKYSKRITDLVFSVEALGPRGVAYKADFGFKEEYAQAYRLETLSSRARTMIEVIGAPVWQYRVDLNLDQRMRVLNNMLRLSHQWAHENRYHTTRINCIQQVFQVIDASVTYDGWHSFRKWVGDVTLFIPPRAPAHLKRRGLASPNKGLFLLPNLEEELGLQKFVKLTDLPPGKRP
jgi:hypothetical protein